MGVGLVYEESESGLRFKTKWFWNFGPLKDEPFFQVQYDEGLRMAMVLKFLEYISYIRIKKSGPSMKKSVFSSAYQGALDLLFCSPHKFFVSGFNYCYKKLTLLWNIIINIIKDVWF